MDSKCIINVGANKVLQVSGPGGGPRDVIDVRRRPRRIAIDGIQRCHLSAIPQYGVGAETAFDGQVNAACARRFVHVGLVRVRDGRAPHAVVCNGPDFASGTANLEFASLSIRFHSHNAEPVPISRDDWR